MIKLVKLEKPDVLADNEAQWTQNLVSKTQAQVPIKDSEKSHYRHPRIKERLIKETGGKCAYCESKLLHIAYGDVEHIHPKKNDIRLTFDWNNLTLACDVCNTNKGSGDDIIDPYSRDPDRHFYVCGPLLLAFSGDEDAYFTQTKLDLNRGDLVERRQKRIEYLQSLCIILAKTNNPAIKEALRQDYLTNETLDEAEYAAISRRFFHEAINNGQF